MFLLVVSEEVSVLCYERPSCQQGLERCRDPTAKQRAAVCLLASLLPQEPPSPRPPSPQALLPACWCHRDSAQGHWHSSLPCLILQPPQGQDTESGQVLPGLGPPSWPDRWLGLRAGGWAGAAVVLINATLVGEGDNRRAAGWGPGAGVLGPFKCIYLFIIFNKLAVSNRKTTAAADLVLLPARKSLKTAQRAPLGSWCRELLTSPLLYTPHA